MALTLVQTKNGPVQGLAIAGEDRTVFWGIPYAQAPVGTLRFQAPQPPLDWEGVRLCTQKPAACVQVDRRRPELPYPISEDSLYLNVFTPAKTAEEKLPVLYWIYGGGFQNGYSASPEFDGAAFNGQGCILVTVNYRVNALGFFNTPDLDAKGYGGNLGLKDQLAGLKWVQENIAAFGGDPERVTVFGQSAGGMSTRMLLTSPLSEGLFSRAIIESGGGLNEADPVRTREDFLKLCQDCLDILGWTTEDLMTRDALEILREIDKAVHQVIPGFAVGYFQPYIDGEVLTDVPGKLIKAGKYRNIPLMVGTVAGDSWMFSVHVKDAFSGQMEYFRGFSYAAGQAWAQNNLACGYQPIRCFYMDRKQPMDGRPKFAHGGPPFGGETPHSSEIPYVFGTLAAKSDGFSAYDYEISRLANTYWANFARTGDPNGEGLPQWPLYTEGWELTMHFGNETCQAENVVLSEKEQEAIDRTIQNPGLLVEW